MPLGAVTSCVGSPSFSGLAPLAMMIECVHVSGLFLGRMVPGRYGIRRSGTKHQTELEALHVTLFSRPRSVRSISYSFSFSRTSEVELLVSQRARSGPPRNSSSLVIMAHNMRAILFARAIAATILGLRARIRPSQEFSAGGRTLAPDITAMRR